MRPGDLDDLGELECGLGDFEDDFDEDLADFEDGLGEEDLPEDLKDVFRS